MERYHIISKRKPKVSVILPVFNGERFLVEAVESILNQTFPDFELIIINDCSRDCTREIANSFKDRRIVYIENNVRSGITRCLNRGIHISKGDLIARMDSDDISYHNRLEIQTDFLIKYCEIDILGSDYECFWLDEKTSELSLIRLPANHEDIKLYLLQTNVLCHPSVIFRKEAFKRNRLFYDRNAIFAEDYKLWVDSVVCGLNLANIGIPLLKYRCHDNQVSSTKRNLQNYTSCQIVVGYAKKMFGFELIDDPLLFLNLIHIERKPVFETKYQAPLIELAERLMEKNEKYSFFDPIKFNRMMNSKVDKIRQLK